MRSTHDSKIKNFKFYSYNSIQETAEIYAHSIDGAIDSFIDYMIGPEPSRVDVILGKPTSLVYFTYTKAVTDLYTCPEQVIEYRIVKE